jgi:tetratricopeptide (TPR) repeat protein
MGEERITPPPPYARRREAEILDEVPPALAIVLWQDVRHLCTWAECTPEERARLFNRDPAARARALTKRREALACVGDLADALATFGDLRNAPVTTDPAALGEACASVVAWALEHDHRETAIEFAEAAALVAPSSPAFANLAGRVTRGANEFERSEIWFQRAIGFARNRAEKIELTRAHLGYGTLCKELGRINCARTHLNSGSALARKYGPPSLAAEAQHDLCALMIVRGRFDEARARARRALQLYPKSHRRLPFFAADVALLFVLERRFRTAVSVLKSTLRIITQPTPRAVVLALSARAAAGAGRVDEAAGLRRRALKLLEKNAGLEGVARWHLADSYRLVGDWEAADQEAQTALRLASDQNDRELARLTHILIGIIRSRVPARPKPNEDADLRDFTQLLEKRISGWVPRRARSSSGPWGAEWVA